MFLDPGTDLALVVSQINLQLKKPVGIGMRLGIYNRSNT